MAPTSPAELASPILAAAVVPWTERYEFAAEPFIRQVRHLARNLTRRYVEGTDADRADLEPDLRRMLNVLLDLARERFHVDGAFDKLIYRVSDPTFPLRLLPPYAAPGEADFERFRAALPVRWREQPWAAL